MSVLAVNVILILIVGMTSNEVHRTFSVGGKPEFGQWTSIIINYLGSLIISIKQLSLSQFSAEYRSPKAMFYPF